MHVGQTGSQAEENVFKGLALFASATMLLCSAFLNAKYLMKISPPDTVYVYAAAGVAAEIFNFTLPFFVIPGVMRMHILRASAGLVIWVCCIAFSAHAAISHIAGSRLDASSGRVATATIYQDVRKELEEARKARGFVPAHRPIATVQAEIDRQKLNPYWSRTNECNQAWGPQDRKFCQTVSDLRAEMGNAMEAKKWQDRIDTLTAKTEAAGPHVSLLPESGDPGASAIGKWFGVDVTTMQGLLSLLGAIMLLVGASLGPYAVLGVSVKPKDVATPQPADAAVLPDPPPTLGLTTEDMRLIDITPPAVPVRALPVLPSPRDLSADAREILRTIGTPSKPTQVRPRDDKDIVGVKFYAWLVANNLTGEFSQQQIDDYYVAYTLADYRQGWDVQRAVKPGLKDLGDKFVEQELRFATEAEIEEGSPKRPTVWHVNKVPHVRLMALLRKYGIEPPDDSVPDVSIPVVESASTPAPEPQATPKNVFSLFGVRKATGE